MHVSQQDICPSAWESTIAAWWLIRGVNILSKAAVFIFKIQALSDSNMPGGITLLTTSILCSLIPPKSLKASYERNPAIQVIKALAQMLQLVYSVL